MGSTIKDSEIIEIEKALGTEFEQEQVEIIKHIGSPANIISCAGSGKTTLMIANISYLQMKYGITGSSIIAISFNRSAVEEIKNRYEKVASKLKLSQEVSFKTFHALYYLILKAYYNDLKVMGEQEAQNVFNRAFYSVSSDKSDEIRDNMASIRTYAVNNLLMSYNQLFSTEKFLTSGVTQQDYINTINEYRKLKEQEDKLDFEDLQIKMLDLLKTNADALEKVRNAWDYWFVDEYQDISKIQMEILVMSVKDSNKLTTIGDEDQCIYEFRGSKVDYIVDFHMYYKNAKKYHISTNYRCPSVILDRASVMIKNNKKRNNKLMKAYEQGGKVIYSSAKTLSSQSIRIANEIYNDKTPFEDVAVLCRNSKFMFIADALIEAGIPLKITHQSGLLHNHSIIKDMRAIIDLALDPLDSYSFQKVFSKISKFINRKQIQDISSEMYKTGKTWYELMYSDYKVEDIYNALERIRGIAENKGQMLDILNIVKELYADHINFLISVNSIDSKDVKDVYDYLEYVSYNKTYRQFIYYLERAKSIIELYSKERNAVTITTIHSVKGLQYDSVYLLDASDYVIPNDFRVNRIREEFGDKAALEYIEQERRLMYVACTRAKKKLHIFYNAESPSRFLNEQLEGTEYTGMLGGEDIVFE